MAGLIVAGNRGVGAPPMDLFPRVGSSLIGAGDPAHAVAIDFNGVARTAGVDVGAYAFAAGGNPGWQLAADFKGFPVGGGDVDAGVDGGGGEAGGCCQTGATPAAPTALGLLVALALARRRRRRIS